MKWNKIESKMQISYIELKSIESAFCFSMDVMWCDDNHHDDDDDDDDDKEYKKIEQDKVLRIYINMLS